MRQLRTGDGINFTRARRMKLAFYVEKEIRRQTGFGKEGVNLRANVTRALNDPLPGMSDELAGGRPPRPPGRDSPQYKMIVRGEALPEVAGRVDDFSWPPKHVEPLLPVAALTSARRFFPAFRYGLCPRLSVRNVILGD